MNYSRSLKILFYLLLFVFLLRNSYSYLDPDLGWHLKIGEDIVRELDVPHIDQYNFTVSGERWVDHEWLFNALLFLMYDKGGYLALNVFFALVIILALLITEKYLKDLLKIQGYWFFYSILAFLGLAGASANWGVRMQEISFLFIIILLYWLKKFEQTKKSLYLFWIIALFVLWTNLHGSFLIGFFIFVSWALSRLIFPYFKKIRGIKAVSWPEKIEKREIYMLSLAVFLAGAATLLTPYGSELYGFLLDYANGFYKSHINEWLPAWEYPVLIYSLLYSAVAATAGVLYLTQKTDSKEPGAFDPYLVLLALFFFILSLASRRHFPLFLAVSLPLAVQAFSAAIPAAGWESGLGPYRAIIRFYCISALILAGLTLGLKTDFTKRPFAAPGTCENYPCAALAAMRQDPRFAEGRLFNAYDWGGYLMWNWPEKPLFIDGRFPQMPFATSTLLEEYYGFFLKDRAPQMLSRYDIDQVLIKLNRPLELSWYDKWLFGKKEDDFTPLNHELISYLETDADWDLAFEDQISKLFIRSK